MAKFSKYQTPKKEAERDLHPVWRGIGCLLWIIVPVMAYASAVLIVNALAAAGMIPAGLLGSIPFPDWVFKTPFLALLARFIDSLDNILAILVFFVAMLVVLTGIFWTLYAWVYQMAGPPRYSALDAPPAGKATKKSR